MALTANGACGAGRCSGEPVSECEGQDTTYTTVYFVNTVHLDYTKFITN